MALVRSYPLQQIIHGISDTERREAAYAEASTLINPKEFGYFSILYGTYNATGKCVKKHQRSYPNRELRKVMDCMPLDRDTWISQSRFKTFKIEGGRALENLQQINALWLDLDYYKISNDIAETSHMTNDVALTILLCELEDRGFPLPSTIVNSGMGLQVKWLLDEPILPRNIKPWNAAQKTLLSWFNCINADLVAKDATRVLRVVGTMHMKSKTMVTRIGGTDERYSFEYLTEFMPGVDLNADADHPFDEATQNAMAAARVARQAAYEVRKTRKTIKVVSTGEKSNMSRKSVQNLNWTRYNDLLQLHKIRNGNMPGQAMSHLLYTLNFLALSGAVTSAEFMVRAGVICEQLGHGVLERSSDLTTLVSKLCKKERGETVPWGGMQWPALYTPKNTTLIELFGISEAEQAQLKTIISTDEKKRRRASRDGFKTDRATYLINAKDKRSMARSMKTEGIPAKVICDELKISRMTLNRYMKEGV